MEEEFVPKKLDEKEAEVNEERKSEPEIKSTNKKRSVGRIISQFIWILLGIIIIAEVGLGILNMQKINDDQEPFWCIKYDKSNNETTCHLGLYVIVKTKEGNKTETSLKPFFLK